jgi:hypothetical protein
MDAFMARIEQFRYIERTPEETLIIQWHMYSLTELRDYLGNPDLRHHSRNLLLLKDLKMQSFRGS